MQGTLSLNGVQGSGVQAPQKRDLVGLIFFIFYFFIFHERFFSCTSTLCLIFEEQSAIDIH